MKNEKNQGMNQELIRYPSLLAACSLRIMKSCKVKPCGILDFCIAQYPTSFSDHLNCFSIKASGQVVKRRK